MDTAHTSMPAVVHVSQMTDATLLVQLAGNWQLRTGVPELTEIQQQLDDTPRVRQLAFEVLNMPAWDTGLLTFLLQLLDHCQQHQIVIDQRGLQEGVRRLLALATAVPEREGARRLSAVLARPGGHGYALGSAECPRAVQIHWGGLSHLCPIFSGQGALSPNRSRPPPPGMRRASPRRDSIRLARAAWMT